MMPAKKQQYFNENSIMQTGKTNWPHDEELEENQTWALPCKGFSERDRGYHGERDNQVYLSSLLQADGTPLQGRLPWATNVTLINTGGNIQKASSTSTSSTKPG